MPSAGQPEEAAGPFEAEVERLSDGSRPGFLMVSLPGVEAGHRLEELLSGRARGRAVYRIDPLHTLEQAGRYLPFPVLTRAFAVTMSGIPRPPAAVVGHCSAAPAALDLAASWSAIGGPPLGTVLLDPVFPGEAAVLQEFAGLRRKLAPGSAAAAGQLGSADSRSPEELVTRMAESLTQAAQDFCQAQELDGAEAESVTNDVVGRYRAWLAFLLGSARQGLQPTDELSGPVHALLSRDRALPPQLERAEGVVQRRLEIPAADLPSSASACEAVLDILDQLEK